MRGIHSRSAHLRIARRPFIDSRPRFPLIFKGPRVIVVGNYPVEDDISMKLSMLLSLV